MRFQENLWEGDVVSENLDGVTYTASRTENSGDGFGSDRNLTLTVS